MEGMSMGIIMVVVEDVAEEVINHRMVDIAMDMVEVDMEGMSMGIIMVVVVMVTQVHLLKGERVIREVQVVVEVIHDHHRDERTIGFEEIRKMRILFCCCSQIH